MADATDVIVVGAGLSGLRAACSIVSAERSVRVVEARSRVGGRLYSVPMGNGIFDRGGQWVGPTQRRVLAAISELGLTTFPTFHEGAKLLRSQRRTRRYEGTIPKLPPLELLQLGATLKTIERLAKKVDPASPWKSPRAANWDRISVAEATRFLVGKELSGSLLAAVRTIWGAEPSELSFLFMLHYVRAAGGFMDLIEIENGAQQDRLVDGAQQIPSGLAERLGERVVTEFPVRRIEQRGDQVIVSDGQREFAASRAIIALPPQMAARIEYAPCLPPNKAALLVRVPMGAATKVFALYDRPFWRDRGLSGEAVCMDPPFSTVFDNSDQDRQYALMGFVVGQPARDFAALSAADRRKAALEQLADLFGPEARSPSYYTEQDWAQEPWTGGCPTGIAGTGMLTTVGPALREPTGRLHFAGTETASEWTGYMEGALEAGERAAHEALISL